MSQAYLRFAAMLGFLSLCSPAYAQTSYSDVSGPVEVLTEVPVYDAYVPTAGLTEGYEAARRESDNPVTPSATVPVLDYDSVVVPQKTNSIAPLDGSGFREESETSRLLIALEDAYAARVAALNVKKAAQRKLLLDQFEREAADSNKVIGLAARMRSAIAELDAVYNTLLETEKTQYTTAMFKVLDGSPALSQ